MSFRVDTYISPISPRVCQNTARSNGQKVKVNKRNTAAFWNDRTKRIKPVQTGSNRFKLVQTFKPVQTGKKQEKSAPSAVATGYINRAATTIATTTVLRSLHSTSIQHHSNAATRDGSGTPSFVSIYYI